MGPLSTPFRDTESGVAAHGNDDVAEPNEQVEALLTYLARTDKKPFARTYEPPAGKPRRSAYDVTHRVTIRNARRFVNGFSIDKEGFELFRFPTRVTHFYDDEEVRSLYYPEVDRRLKQLTGATR